MTPYYSDSWLTVYQGDCREVMRSMEPESVHCVVTSPPYWGLRDYGIAPSVWPVLNGMECVGEHWWGEQIVDRATNHTDKRRWQHTRNGRDEEQPPEKRVAWRRTEVPQGAFCEMCGAWSGALGLEPTPDLYAEHIVDVMREARRVLRKDGTLWLNIGDGWASHDPGGYREGEFLNPNGRAPAKGQARNRAGTYASGGLKPKDLVMVPARTALALQADGWWLRSEIVWHKPNPMPESVTDRPTKSHEMIYLLSRSRTYHYDADAIREPDSGQDHPRSVLAGQPSLEPTGGLMAPHKGLRQTDGRNGAGRNVRSVWTIPTRPYPGAHFATFPREIPTRAIKAGCPADGTVLDPFAGSGTTGMVAQSLGRRAILIDLNGDYLVQAMRRNRDIPLGLDAA